MQSALKASDPGTLCTIVSSVIGRPLEYQFYHKRNHQISDQTTSWSSYLRGCQHREYHCSQRDNHRAPLPESLRQRNRPSMTTFDCHGSIQYIFAPTAPTEFALHPQCPLQPGKGMILWYQHPAPEHPGRSRPPMSAEIKAFIEKGNFQTPRKAFHAILEESRKNQFPFTPIHHLSPMNVHYWWTVAVQKQHQYNSTDPWQNAYQYLRARSEVRSFS